MKATMPVKRAPRRNLLPKGEITIERNVPVPEHLADGNDRPRYPVHALKPGQSFSFQAGSDAVSQLRSVKSSIFHHRSRNPEKRFVAAIQGNVIRCWRLRDEPAARK